MTEPRTSGPWIVGRPGGPDGLFWSVVNQQGMVVAMRIMAEEDARAIAELPALREALRRTESHLSLLRHRGGIPWGTPGIGSEHEYDAVIGKARRLLGDAG